MAGAAPSLTFRLAVGSEEVRVEYRPDYFPSGEQDLFSFVSPDEPDRPHCLSPTGHLSKLVPHDAVEAIGGPRAYAALFAEARLAGQEEAFNAAFEGDWPEAKQLRRRKKSRSPPAPSSSAEGPGPVVGRHTAEVIEEQAGMKDRDGPPHQGMLF